MSVRHSRTVGYFSTTALRRDGKPAFPGEKIHYESKNDVTAN